MTEPRWCDVTTPVVQLRALVWGPEGGPIALCLHGFPDTAYSWRKVGPILAEAGWKVVAPFQPLGRVPDGARLAAQLPRQLLRSWYMLYFQLPWLPERSASWVVTRLWRWWSPGYSAAEDLRHVDAAIGAPARWRAAIGYYRAMLRGTTPPARYASLHQHWMSAPRIPSLYLHGADDGCATPDYARWVERILPEGSAVGIVDQAGHFLQLEQPDAVAGRILDFIGSAGTPE